MKPKTISEAVYFRMMYDQQRDRRNWEQARVISYFSIAANLKKGGLKNHTELFSFPWDDEDDDSRLLEVGDFTEEQRQRIIQDLRNDGF